MIKIKSRMQKYIILLFVVMFHFIFYRSINIEYKSDVLISFFAISISAIIIFYSSARFLLVSYLYTAYFLVLGVFQYLQSSVRPEGFLGFNIPITLITNIELRYIYFKYLLLFYIISISTITLRIHIYKINNKLNQKKIDRSNLIKKTKIYITKINPYILLIGYFVIEYFVRNYFQILVPGKSPKIAHSGIIVYLVLSMSIYIKFIVVLFFYKKYGKSNKYYINLLFIVILSALPSVLLGARSTFILNAVHLILFNLFLDDNQQFYKKKSNKIIIVIFILIGLASINLGNTLRMHNDLDMLAFLTRRFTGITDAIAAINYYKSGGELLGLKNYVFNILNMGDIRVTTFYTKSILFFPTEGITANALPLFSAALLYYGLVGIGLFSIVFAWTLSSIEIRLSEISTNHSNYRIIKDKYIYSYLILNIFIIMIIEGNIDHVNIILIPYIAFQLFTRILPIMIKKS
ncbi:hypothetical protein [Desulfosporosinus sp. BICA1-9]|uniref:hypothetical protein n=1 Tax=Desulfosporosinus sp. BICA1-9 TaxID=1531958 RepID=UPI00054B26EB|nr:hypothetical protein [Desulfosporosinus sp. BICA1-9]KJS49027.1 MAG: hypothetical protein VR66_10795 [Peptococcaceae bacterium BRH_c23]KJS90757.1 MAG: hypothetical protein JL57_00090 [Desulfosporosinus sp. BICA1-9]HBW35503.1 hypothetical protein [Desulfosporosinus sp.]